MRAARSFGFDVPLVVGENDPAILALKVRHTPLDPHRYLIAAMQALLTLLEAIAREIRAGSVG